MILYGCYIISVIALVLYHFCYSMGGIYHDHNWSRIVQINDVYSQGETVYIIVQNNIHGGILLKHSKNHILIEASLKLAFMYDLAF